MTARMGDRQISLTVGRSRVVPTYSKAKHDQNCDSDYYHAKSNEPFGKCEYCGSDFI